jgi:hypothetical protein
MAQMLLLVDVNVPQSVSSYFASRGHDVRQTRDLFGEQATDAAIVANAVAMRAVVLTMDKDYTRLAQRAMDSSQAKKRSWGLILLQLREPQALARVKMIIDSIEFEFEQGSTSAQHGDCLLLNVHVHERHLIIKR